MTEFYRLVKTKFVDDAFSGDGAKTYGGRWNRIGSPCVYLGGSIAMCVLESLVHLSSPAELRHFTLLTIEIPDELTAPLATLPDDWDHTPAPAHVQAIGSEWLASMTSLALLVPSTITGEDCALLNPLHPAIHTVLSSVKRRDFPIDARLFKVHRF